MPDTLSLSPSSGLGIEMDDHASSSGTRSSQRLLQHETEPGQGRLAGVARHTLGLILLLCVVFFWTMCNFLGSVCQTPPQPQDRDTDLVRRVFLRTTHMRNRFSSPILTLPPSCWPWSRTSFAWGTDDIEIAETCTIQFARMSCEQSKRRAIDLSRATTMA